MARKFSKIFHATITFGDDVTISETKKAVVYAKAPAATIKHPNGEVNNRTVMAFGKQLSEVQNEIFPGNTAVLAVQYDGGTVKIVGYPHKKAA